tara:strand:- start:13627 stop:15219 length:1593 start_codon:yes stop_codon:yes gene_type:complete
MLLPKIKLSDIRDNFSYYECKAENEKYNGSFIEIKKNEKEISVKVDLFSRIPFYYYINKKNMYGNSSFIELIIELKNNNISLSLDYVSIASFLKNNCFTENSTYFKEVLRVPPGSKINFNCNNGLTTIEQYYKYEPETLKEDNIDIIANNYVKILKSNFQNYLDQNNFENVGISLTGGFDSRMILSLLDDIKIKPTAFHYGHKDSNDFKISKKICKEYDLNNSIIEWRDLSYFKNKANLILHESDFMLPLHHSHMHQSIFEQKKKVDTIFYGHFMDMQMQGHFYNEKFENNTDQVDVSSSLKEMWCGKESAFSVLNMKTFKKIFSEDVVENYELNINNMLDKYSYLKSDKQYEISYLLNHGTRRAIAQCQLGSKHLDYYIPALQKNIFEFVWSLDTKIKKKRNLQKIIFKKFFEKNTNLDFVLDNYKILNLKNENLFNKNISKLIGLLKHPKINILKPYFDFWGKEYYKFDNYKNWMIEKILENESLFDNKFIDKSFFLLLKKNQANFPFAFISTLFTISQFLVFFKKIN